jgi:hypothetical protein
VAAPVERLAAYLSAFDAGEIGVHGLPSPELDMTLTACRLAGKDVVSLGERPRVVVTADGMVDAGIVRCLKDEVDAAVPDAACVIVVRHAGDVPLAATLDAYLDVEMIPGRDVWFDDVCAGTAEILDRL